jgi:hypothetical protein
MSGVTPLKSKSQTDCNKDLRSQPTHYSCSKDNDGYYMIATNIPLFQAINQLSIILDPIRLDEGGGSEETLRRSSPTIIRTRLLFNNTNLERERKRAASSKISSHDVQSKVRRTSIEGHVCFLCEKENPTSELRQAMTMQLDKRLNECARNLNGGKLLAVLCGGDVVAQELKYHYSCLTALFHKERAYLLTIENRDDIELTQEREVYPLVFSELPTYIVEIKTSSDNPVVFRLADLVSLYKQRLEQLVMKTPDVNATRLKEKLLAEIPEFESHKKARDIFLALKKDIGASIHLLRSYYRCQSCHDLARTYDLP